MLCNEPITARNLQLPFNRHEYPNPLMSIIPILDQRMSVVSNDTQIGEIGLNTTTDS